jgi:hypothetical protein
MTDSHPKAFFQRITAYSTDETFPLLVCGLKLTLRSAIYRPISKLFDIALAVFYDRH